MTNLSFNWQLTSLACGVSHKMKFSLASYVDDFSLVKNQYACCDFIDKVFFVTCIHDYCPWNVTRVHWLLLDLMSYLPLFALGLLKC